MIGEVVQPHLPPGDGEIALTTGLQTTALLHFDMEIPKMSCCGEWKL